MSKKYIKKEGLVYRNLPLKLDGNPYAETDYDRKMLTALYAVVNENRRSFFMMLRKQQYRELTEWANSKLPSELTDQRSFVPTWGTKCVWLFNGMTCFPKCPVCGKTYGDSSNVSPGKGYNGHCSNRCKTLDPNVQRLMSDTCSKLYGCDWSSKAPSARQAYVETCRSRYGVDNTFQLESSKDKGRQTRKRKYGDENFRNSEKQTETCMKLYGKGSNGDAIGETLRSLPPRRKSEWVANIKRSKKDTYGDENYNNPERRRETCIRLYGVPSAPQSDVCKEHARETFMKNYGYDHNWKSPEVRDEMRRRHLEAYGVEYPSQRPEVADATRQSKISKFGTACSPSWRYTYDGLSFDSSWELAFYIWLRDNKADFTYPCDIRFDYFDSSGRKHIYNPDFRVGTAVVEIKGGHFLDKDGRLVLPYRGKKSDEEYARLCDVNAAKYRCMLEHGVTVYTEKDVRPYVEYVERKYGECYMKSFGKPRRKTGTKR